MPELSKDAFGDAMARAFFLRESPLDHHHAIDHHHSSHAHQQPFFYGSAYTPVMYKPPHQERQKIPLGMSTHLPSLSLSDRDALLRHATSFLPLDSDAACHQQQQQQQQHTQQQLLQQSVPGFSPYALPHYQPLQLEVPEIEECSTWMSDVLDDFPAISTPELPPLVSTANGSFDGIAPSPEFSCPISLPVSQQQQQQQQPALPPRLEDESAAPPPQPTTPPTTVKSSHSRGVSSPTGASAADDFSSLSPTPKPLKPRGSKRCQRVIEKSKKVSNVEQLEHVRRERQRRDDMSFKISTLECLLPPAGPNLKRDRASIVHDSVHYLKSLQGKVEELKKTMAELKLKKSTRAAPRSDAVNVGNHELAASSSKFQLVEYHIQVEGEGVEAARLEKCRCPPSFMSSAMKVLEHLNLDVCRCTITKMFDYTICVIIAKPRLTSNQVATSASVVSALRSSLQQS